jgi:hypothetical protein
MAGIGRRHSPYGARWALWDSSLGKDLELGAYIEVIKLFRILKSTGLVR